MPRKRQRQNSYSEEEILRQQGLFEVEKLLKVRKVERLERLESTQGRYGIKKPNYAQIIDFEYLVKWKGYGDADNSWEPEKNLLCENIVKIFWESSNIEKQYMVSGVEYDPEHDSVGPEAGSSTEDGSENEHEHESWDNDAAAQLEYMPMVSPEPDPPKEKLLIKIFRPAKKRRVDSPEDDHKHERLEVPASPEPTFTFDQLEARYNTLLPVVHIQNDILYIDQAPQDPIGMVADDFILWLTETPSDMPLPCMKTISPTYFDPITKSFQQNSNFVPMRPHYPRLDTTPPAINYPAIQNSYQYSDPQMPMMFPSHYASEPYIAHNHSSYPQQVLAIDAYQQTLQVAIDTILDRNIDMSLYRELVDPNPIS